MLAKKGTENNNNHKYDFLNDIDSFDDVYNITSKMSLLEKGNLFEIITYYLFKLSPTLNTKLQNIWLYKDIPTKIIHDLNLPDRDKGIDILLDIDGEYYAVQSKFRQDKNSTVSWGELSTFFGLSFGITDKIKGGYLVTNTYDVCDQVTKSSKVRSIFGIFFDELPDNFFKNVAQLINGKNISNQQQRIPLPHQQNCVDICHEHYKIETRGYIEMACGTGKTLAAYWIDKKMGNKLTLIFVPSLYLLSQFYREWVRQSYSDNIKINYILIGSDADTDEETKHMSGGLILETHTNIIKQQVDKHICSKTVIICTYQSCDKLFGAINCADLAIFDEAHRTAGKTEKYFSTMMNDNKDKNMKINKRLFMTATPKIYIKNKNRENDDDVVSMKNEKYYGKKIYSYNTSSAINDKRLTEYQLLTIVIHDKEIEEQISSNKLVEYKNLIMGDNAQYIAFALALLKKIHAGECNHMVTFHNTISKSNYFSKLLTKLNKELYEENIYISELNGSIAMNKRHKIIKEYTEHSKSILCSTRILVEGIDIPIIDSICFADNKTSTIDIVQSIGRALRLHKNKTIANIIVPIFTKNIDHVFDDDCDGVMRVLSALKSTDDCVVDYFTYKNNTNNMLRRNIFVYEMYKYGKAYDIHTKLLDNTEINLARWKECIELSMQKNIDPFIQSCDDLAVWIEKNNRLPIATKYNDVEYKLGQFCSQCRARKKRNTLSADKIQKLEKIDRWHWLTSKSSKDMEIYVEIKNWITTNGKLPSSSGSTIEERIIWRLSKKMLEMYESKELDDDLVRKFNNINISEWILDNDDKYWEMVIRWASNHNNLHPSPHGKSVYECVLGAWLEKTIVDLRIYNKKLDSYDYDSYKCTYLLNDWENFFYNKIFKYYYDDLHDDFVNNKNNDDVDMYDDIFNKIHKEFYGTEPDDTDMYDTDSIEYETGPINMDGFYAYDTFY